METKEVTQEDKEFNQLIDRSNEAGDKLYTEMCNLVSKHLSTWKEEVNLTIALDHAITTLNLMHYSSLSENYDLEFVNEMIDRNYETVKDIINEEKSPEDMQ